MDRTLDQPRGRLEEAERTQVDRAVCAAVQEARQEHRLFPAAPERDAAAPVVVGVSGGADSVCLLHLLVRQADAWNLALHVAHLDHGLRPSSAEDAEFVARLAAKWGLPLHRRRLDPGTLGREGANLEEAARMARYRFLLDVAQSVGHVQAESRRRAVPTVAVAHTRDDQAETLLMHLLRGSGLEGLGAMRHKTLRPYNGGEAWVVRPLLDISRTDILRYLSAHGLTWREDPSNLDTRFTRNWLRHEILPRLAERNPQIHAALARTARVLAAEADRADDINRAAFTRLLHGSLPARPAVRIVMARAAFLSTAVATQRGVLRVAWQQLGAPMEAFTFAHVDAILRSLPLIPGNAGPFPIAAGVVWSVIGAHFSLHHEDALPLVPSYPYLDSDWRSCHGAVPVPGAGDLAAGDWTLGANTVAVEKLPKDWRNNPDPWQAFLDADAAGCPVLTTPRPGQQIAPLGMHGHTKTLGDLFTDRKIPPPLRPGWPLIVDAATGTVLWACGIQPAHPARIRPGTRRVLHLRWMHGDGARDGTEREETS